ANACLAAGVAAHLHSPATPSSLMVSFEDGVQERAVLEAISALRKEPDDHLPSLDDEALEAVKFAQAVPPQLLMQMLQRRLADLDGASAARQLEPRLHDISRG